jgi:hypothetical protein
MTFLPERAERLVPELPAIARRPDDGHRLHLLDYRIARSRGPIQRLLSSRKLDRVIQ